MHVSLKPPSEGVGHLVEVDVAEFRVALSEIAEAEAVAGVGVHFGEEPCGVSSDADEQFDDWLEVDGVSVAVDPDVEVLVVVLYEVGVLAVLENLHADCSLGGCFHAHIIGPVP